MAHKLLLADDSITIQRVIELTFAEEDVQVLAVGDGKHAIDRIQVDRPDIVLADVGMPERDGYEVAAFIKGNPQLAHIPVLLLTGAFEPIDEGRARAVGCDGVLVKPFEPQMVINRVKDLLAGRRTGASGNAGPGDGRSQSDDPTLAATPRQGADSLEDYFDRLDAAFATLGADAPAAAATGGSTSHAPTAAASRSATVEDFASWDPDLAADAARPSTQVAPAVTPIPVVTRPADTAPTPVAAPAPLEAELKPTAAPTPAPEVSAPPQVETAPPHPGAGSQRAPASAPQISLAEAFSALLAAEHGQALAPPQRRAAAAPSPDVVDDIVRRVIDRLQEQDVRHTVVEVAERLVRVEIDRIKRTNS